MKNNILPLAKELIKIPSISGDIEQAVEITRFTEKQLAGYNFRPFVSDSIPSLLYSNKDKNTKDFKIILNAHLDVVPGSKDQFKPIEKNGRLYGRGSYDTKAAAAAMILLFKEIGPKVSYPLGLQITTDEEIGGGDGTKYQLDKGVRADFMIASECGSNFNIVHEAKARLVVKLVAKGKTSHSAYPWLGDNAIWKLQQGIHAILQHYPSPKEAVYQTTVNVTHIQTQGKENRDTAYNRTPDYCEALLDVRYVPSERNTILDQLQALLIAGVSLEVIHNTVPHQTDSNNKYIHALQKAGASVFKKELNLAKQNGTSDVRHYSEVGNDGIEFGPIGGNQHTDDEWVDINSLDDYYAILKQFLVS